MRATTLRTEVVVEPYRIDAVRDGRLIEIQHGSLAAIRDKIGRLLKTHEVLLVKPIVARKLLVRQGQRAGEILSRRRSPKRGTLVDIFDELVYFTRVFPHPKLTLEIVLVEIEEWRYPGHGRRRRWRRGDHVVADQKLVALGERRRLSTAADLIGLLGAKLPRAFHTGDLAERLGIGRHVAQRIAYCLREMQAIEQTGKQGNALVYRVKPPRRRGRRVA